MAVQFLDKLQYVRVDGLIDDVLCEPSSAVPSVLLSLLELPQDSEVRRLIFGAVALNQFRNLLPQPDFLFFLCLH